MPADLKRVSRDTLYIAIFTTITIGVWIGLEVIRSLTRPQAPRVRKEQLEPLPANLNQQVLSELKQKVRIKEEELTSLPKAVTESGKRASIGIEASEGGELVEP